MEFFNDFYSDLQWVFKNCNRLISGYPEVLKSKGLDYLALYDVFNENSAKNYICYLLPFWVNYNCKLERDALRKISLANTFMMLFAFTQDDVMDNDIGSLDKADMLSLGNLFFTDFIELYRDVLGADPRFWRYFRLHMRKWAEAVASEKRGFRISDNLLDEEILSVVSGKADPVKLAAVAVCVMTDREEWIDKFSMAVDRVLFSLQIADDCADWREDLKNRNTNLLLHEVMRKYRVSNIESLNESDIKTEVFLGDIMDIVVKALRDNSKRLEEISLEGNPYFKGFNQHLLDIMETNAKACNERKRAAELGGFFYWYEKNIVES